ncbi:curved DNA-binding protein [Mucilaginibacter yixingensis]|uniref:Curved DNA-binding protein n=1 Tax=Mucilaginibacter yixingensis TaxID=1295612 RepID=A0A2T5JF26_9SPHI|nr:J domain-containing protein [Mucilaginibacter yixingensis]PTR01040.1 curved DNA-binding protein [Mucilaginibacter yixingensis]
MAFIDYYKVLGVDKNADEKAIRNAYRKLARKYHPDLNPNDTEANKRFQELNEANEVLSDPEKRKKYDEYGENWQHADAYEQAKQQQRQYSYSGGGTGSAGGFEGFGADTDFSEFFNSMFGGSGGMGGAGRQTRYRGQDYNAELKLTLNDIAETHKQTLTVNGKQIRITIPAGVENGQTIKIKDHGAPGVNGGPAGDLFITFNIANHLQFKRQGADLFEIIKIDLYTAVLGGDITAETLTGKVKLKVQPETQNGTKVKLKGKGLPVYKHEGQHGDLYLTYDVQLPTKLTDKQKELFEHLAKLNTEQQ